MRQSVDPNIQNKTNTTIKTPYLLILPFLILFLMFWFFPLVQGFNMSLKEDVIFGKSEYIGFSNYWKLLGDQRFFNSLYNTFMYAIGTLAAIIPLSILLAHWLKGISSNWREVILFLFLLPGLTSPIVLGFLFVMIFNGEHGILNMLTTQPLGLKPINWIIDPNYMKIALVLQAVWRWTGFITYFYLAALEGIPKIYYDIAKVEGSSAWNTFWSITIPSLKNITFFVSIFLMLEAFILFEGAYNLLRGSGGIGDAALLFISYVHHKGFDLLEYNYAAALSFSMVPIFGFIVFGYFWLQRKRKQPEE